MTNEISPYVSPQFIKVYENVISHSFCDDLIQKFESNSDKWENRNRLSPDRNLSFKELHWFKDMDTWKNETDTLTNTFIQYIDDYKSEFSKFCFPLQDYLIVFEFYKVHSK